MCLTPKDKYHDIARCAQQRNKNKWFVRSKDVFSSRLIWWWMKKKKSCLISKAIFSDILGDGRMVMLVHITKISDGLIPEKSGQGESRILKSQALAGLKHFEKCRASCFTKYMGSLPGLGLDPDPSLTKLIC